ncbi:MAG: SGNH/GDSL hydrolase family protein, partial [Gorillibacterium sp.]|nr:SGNH/GDSL hydrolase family protein [Gorillibacterium sp.]
MRQHKEAQQEWFSSYTIRGGMRTAAQKLHSSEEMTIAFIGGSVTEGAGASDGENTSYRAITCRYLEQRFPAVAFTFINAAIGGTDSVYGAYRLGQDVLQYGPIDLLFVEFAVNDAGNRSESLRAMEGIVRHAKRITPQTDICFLYMANKTGLEQFCANGRVQNNIYHHEEVAEHYQLPSVSIALAIYRRIAAGLIEWEQISGDEVHPNDAGYALYAQ